MKPERLLARIRAGHWDNVRFDDFLRLIEAYGFRPTRVRGSHQIYQHPVGPELVVQPRRRQAKPYQIREFLRMIDEYALRNDP